MRLAADSLIQWSDEHLCTDAGYRTYVIGGQVRAVSPYLVDGHTF